MHPYRGMMSRYIYRLHMYIYIYNIIDIYTYVHIPHYRHIYDSIDSLLGRYTILYIHMLNHSLLSGIWSGVFFLSRPEYAIRGTGILGRIASFERRLRGAAPAPLVLPCPFRTSTWTRTDAERDKREVAKYRLSRRNFGGFGCILMSAAPGWFTNRHYFQTVLTW